MATLTVYDAEGNEYTPDGETTGRNERIKELNLASVRFAIEPQQRRVTGYFRAKETQTARAEQYYAEFTARNASDPVGEFTDALRTRLDEWGYILDESAGEMAVFQRLENPDRASTPGRKNDRTILQDLAADRQLTNVGVGSPEAAVGLLSELADSHSVAITSAEATSLSAFDVAITVGRYSGIEPLGETETRWDQAKQSLRDQLVGEEIDTIKQSVQTLKRDHGLSAAEIQRKVPGLSSTGSTGPSPRRRPTSKSEQIKQTLFSPKVGKYMFIGAVVLLVLLGGFYGAIELGLVDFGGGDTTSGTVSDSVGVFSFLPFIGGSDDKASDDTESADDSGDTPLENGDETEEGSENETDSKDPTTGKAGGQSSTQTFSLQGEVTLEYGQSKEGVNVIIANESLLSNKEKGEISVESDESGDYKTDPVLPNGTYSIETSIPVSDPDSGQSYSESVVIAGNTTENIQLE